MVVDVARVKNRLKSVLRSRGVVYGAGRSVYAKRERERWLGELPEATRPLAELLYSEHDALAALKARAEKALLAEARKHREWRLLKTCPGLGPIRTAELLPVVVTPYRFRSRSGFWAYCGLGIVISKRGVERSARNHEPDEGEANRLQGRASTGLLGWASGPSPQG